MSAPQLPPVPLTPCPNCRGTNVFRLKKAVSGGGGYAPNLLPGLPPWWRSARMYVVVCGSCGLIRLHAEREVLKELPSSDRWERV